MLENYDALGAYGTWFAGIITAFALFLSVWTTSNNTIKQMQISVKRNILGEIELKVYNGSRFAIMLNDLGLFASGHFFQIRGLNDDFIQAGKTMSYVLSSEEWNRIIKTLKEDVNWYLNETIPAEIWRVLNGKSFHVNSFELKRKIVSDRYSIKLAVYSSGNLYTSKRWLKIETIEGKDEIKMGRDAFYKMRRHWMPNAPSISCVIPLFGFLGTLSAYEVSDQVSAGWVDIISGVLMYILGVIETNNGRYSGSYYGLIGFISGLMVTIGLTQAFFVLNWANIVILLFFGILVSISLGIRMMKNAGKLMDDF